MNEKIERLINRANGSIIGIGVNPKEGWTNLLVFGGFDGSPDFEDWTQEDKKELADFMITKWQEWKDAQ